MNIISLLLGAWQSLAHIQNLLYREQRVILGIAAFTLMKLHPSSNLVPQGRVMLRKLQLAISHQLIN
ncbi:MAG: hypothetical protein WCB17_04290 [Dehalococcoidales bacterium]